MTFLNLATVLDRINFQIKLARLTDVSEDAADVGNEVEYTQGYKDGYLGGMKDARDAITAEAT